MPDPFLTRFLLALCLWREARGESPRGRRLVGLVIRNRLEDARHRWPRTYRDVILQPKQFSAFNAGDANATLFPRDTDLAWGDCVAAADEVLAGTIQHPLPGINHYHTLAVTPAWRDPAKEVVREGSHVFYAL